MIPISATAEHIGIETALLLAGCLLAVSLFLLRWWIPELAKVGRGHGEELEGAPEIDPITDDGDSVKLESAR
jgi:hypothetical protein